MELIQVLIIFVTATIILTFAADYFVEAIEKIGAALKLPHFFTGILFVAIGTSLPELMTGVSAVLKDETDLLAGNVFGSDIANILLGLGAVVWLSGKDIKYKTDIFAVHFPILLISFLLSVGMMQDLVVTQLEGAFLLFMLGIYLWFLYGQKDAHDIDDMPDTPWSWQYVAVALLSLVAVLFSSDFLVSSVLDLATLLNFSSTALSATLIAIGTSLPEMMVVYSSLKKGNAEMAIGNILGSNIFNIVLIFGVGAVIAPLTISTLTWTVIVPFLGATLLVYWAVSKNREITRHEGLAMACMYLFFVGKLYNWL